MKNKFFCGNIFKKWTLEGLGKLSRRTSAFCQNKNMKAFENSITMSDGNAFGKTIENFGHFIQWKCPFLVNDTLPLHSLGWESTSKHNIYAPNLKMRVEA
jgi:hypothetical protein